MPTLDPNTPPPHGCFIANEYSAGKGTSWKLTNPKNSQPFHELTGASSEQVHEAVDAATHAFHTGEWSRCTGYSRGRYLTQLADLIEENGHALATFESLASGRPISMVLKSDVPRVAEVFRYYAGWADKIRGDSFPAEDGFYKIVEQKPLGVCAAITAWNASLHFLAWKVGPALALGNTVIIKPSEKSPLGTLAFGSLVQAAGLPAGVVNILSGDGTIGDLLARHGSVQKVSFTGSLKTGRKIQIAAAQSNLKRVTLELGGKSPAIVFEDADLPTALTWCVRGITVNSGQICAATSRLLVHESMATEFVQRLQREFDAIAQSLGQDPQEMTTTYGPLVDRAQYESVASYVGDEEQRRQLLGRPLEDGHYMPPIVIQSPSHDSPVYQEEVFGPVLCVESFATEDEALRKAHDTEYGLAASIYTQNLNRAVRIWQKIGAGSVYLNCAAVVGPQVPCGGFQSSGLGRELGEYALRHYAEPRTIWIK
ncbi:hypothetical protein AWENTII_011954 [Aspergillus wentii]